MSINFLNNEYTFLRNILVFRYKYVKSLGLNNHIIQHILYNIMHGNSIKYTDTHTFISLRFYFISKTNFVKVCSNVNNNKYEKQNNSPFFF